MSGPKCARVSLADEEALRRQLAAEAAWRYQQEQERQRQERERIVAAVRSQASQALEHARAEIARVRAAGAEQYASDGLDAAQAALQRGQQSFRRGDFDAGDLARAMTEAQAAAQEAQKVERIMAARREEERLRREMEQQQAEAAAALAAAKQMSEYMHGTPHARFAPGAYPAAVAPIAEAGKRFEAGDFKGARAAAEQASSALSQLEESVRQRYAAWRARRAAAEAALAGIREVYDSLDRDFTQRWTKARLDAVEVEIARLEAALANEDFDVIPPAAPGIIERIDGIRGEADEAYARSKRRERIVNGITQALYDMGYEVGAYLEDENDPTGNAIVSANHPSGKRVAMDVGLDSDDVHLDLDDDPTTGSHVGADCVADVHDLIERLQDQGINFEMTDWGYADPARVKNSASASSASARGQTATRHGGN